MRLIAPPEKAMTLELTWGITDEEFDREIELIARSGITWGRVGIAWRDLETAKGVFSAAGIATVERTVSALTDIGVRILAEVDSVPDWANGLVGQRYHPATNVQDWKDYVTFIVQTWGDRVKHWGIWNEPNHPQFWHPTPDAAEYVPVLKAAHDAAKAVDPDCLVVLGGLSFNDYEYLEACYAVEPNLGDWFDAIDVHPYTRNGVAPDAVFNDGPGGRISKDSFSGYKEVGATMAANGDRKPIWISEFGWSTCSPPHPTLGGVSEVEQAAYIADAFRLMQGEYLRQEEFYVSVACVYILRQSWVGAGGEAADPADWVTHLSLVRYDFTEKAAFGGLCDIRNRGWTL